MSLIGVQELSLLNFDAPLEDATEEHEITTAPLVTREAYAAVTSAEKKSQYGVLGSLTEIRYVSLQSKFKSMYLGGASAC